MVNRGHSGRRVRGVLARAIAVIALAGSILPLPLISPIAPVAAVTTAATTVPAGFTDEVLATGLNHPTMISFGSDGRVFVAERRGVVKTWASYASLVADDAPVQTLDIQGQVMGYWDRGLLGMAIDPQWPASGHQNIYLLYTYDAKPGGAAPLWNDACPNPPGATSDGCVVTGRLDKVQVSPSTGLAGTRTTLITDWCQQFPSHSIGSLAFGADGMLYASGGDGASFNGTGQASDQDWGQWGGTLPNTTSPVTPANPCGDPVDATKIPPIQSPPALDANAQGGALRAQNVRTTQAKVSLDGAILRLDPSTGAAAAGNPLIASSDLNKRRIVAYGLRNPFRITFRPGTNDLYVGDVGHGTWEEVNRLANPVAAGGPPNFGWPCYEANDYGRYYQTVSLNLCSSLASGSVTFPILKYDHVSHIVADDNCSTSAGSSIAGLAFYTGASYPTHYANGLFAADYSRKCIVFMPAGTGGIPDPARVEAFASNLSNPVALVAAPNGDILYPDFSPSSATAGAIHRIRYLAPTAAFTATPTSGTAPLSVSFDGSASTSQAGGLSYVWNFGDGSGNTAPSVLPSASHTYTNAGTYTARLIVTDANDVSSQVTHQVSASNTAPVVTIDTPGSSLTWKVGDTINLTGHASDTQDGTIPGSSLSWNVVIKHCPTGGACHDHTLASFTGTSGSITAPDHAYPTYLHIELTATDSDGLASTAAVDIQPKTSVITVASSPASMPVSLGGTSGTAPISVTGIVGSQQTLAATTPVAVGENHYTFSGWSDGGSASHQVTYPASPTTLTATYTLVQGDASNTCSGAPIQSSYGSWWSGTLGTATDIDWYRFRVTSTTTVRSVLGNLPVGARLDLYSGCSTLLATSDRGGTSPEELIRSLKAGTYGLKVSAKGAFDAANPYQLRARSAGTSVIVLSSKATVSGSQLMIVGEVLNASGSSRGPIKLAAKLYDATGHLLTTWTNSAYKPVLGSLKKSPFKLFGSVPAGFHHATLSVTYSPRTSAAIVAPSVHGVSGAGDGTGGWITDGDVTNTGSTTMRSIRVFITLYDALDQVYAVGYVAPVKTTLTAHASTTFSCHFLAVSPPRYTGPNGRGKH